MACAADISGLDHLRRRPRECAPAAVERKPAAVAVEGEGEGEGVPTVTERSRRGASGAIIGP